MLSYLEKLKQKLECSSEDSGTMKLASTADGSGGCGMHTGHPSRREDHW